MVDFQALVGDAVDNVPGVPLIGPKLARQLLEQYGTLEAVLDHATDVAGAKRRENLVKFRDQALLSRQLVRLDAQTPVAIDWAGGRAGNIDVPAALALFRELGFRSFGAKVAALAAGTGDGGRWRVRGRGIGGEARVTEYGVRSRRRSARGCEASDSAESACRHSVLRTPYFPLPRIPLLLLLPLPRPPSPVPHHPSHRYPRAFEDFLAATPAAVPFFARYRNDARAAALGGTGGHFVCLG